MHTDLKKYAMLILGNKGDKIRVTKIHIKELNEVTYIVKYNYRDEDLLPMTGLLTFTKKEFNKYMRNLKIKKLYEVNL